MRHRIKKDKLNRDYDHIRALRFSLAKSLIEHKQIVTTLPKAKFIKPYVERLVTIAKRGDSLEVRRLLLKRLRNNKDLVELLISKRAPANKNRPGGYLRIQKFFKRAGDNAKMAKISWVDYDIPMEPKPKKAPKKETKKPKKEVKKEAKVKKNK